MPYLPKTAEERNEAFGLLDELLKKLGREEALRRELARSLSKLPLEELELEELRKELRRAARRERLVLEPRGSLRLSQFPRHLHREDRLRLAQPFRIPEIRLHEKTKRFTDQSMFLPRLQKFGSFKSQTRSSSC